MAGTARGRKGLFPLHSLGFVILRGSWFLLANVCLCVEAFSAACCTQMCKLNICVKNKGGREGRNKCWVERMELVETGRLPSQMGASLPPQCHCNSSVLTAIASLCHKAWQVAGCVVSQSTSHLLTRTPFPLIPLRALSSGHIYSVPPASLSNPLPMHSCVLPLTASVCSLKQPLVPPCPPESPTGDKGTKRAGGGEGDAQLSALSLPVHIERIPTPRCPVLG